MSPVSWAYAALRSWLIVLVAGPMLAGCGAGGSDEREVAAWAASMYRMDEDLTFLQIPAATVTTVENQTVRQLVRLALGGSRIRLRLSNAHGTDALPVEAVRVAKALSGGSIDATTSVAVTFGGKGSIQVPAGQEAWSDLIPFDAVAGGEIAASVYIRARVVAATGHRLSAVPSYVMAGNATSTETPAPSSQVLNSYLWLSEVDVATAAATNVVVAYGDSITASGLTRDAYPAQLNDRLRSAGLPRQVAVLNAGVGGGRWLHDRVGVRGTSRFAHDVLQTTGVTHTLILMGINDIGFGTAWLPAEAVTEQQLISALDSAIKQSVSRGVKPILGTLTPFNGYAYFSPSGERIRQAVNAWIRANREAFAIVDFDAALRDSGDPSKLAAEFDSGDHLHPSSRGRSAMQALVSESLFR